MIRDRLCGSASSAGRQVVPSCEGDVDLSRSANDENDLTPNPHVNNIYKGIIYDYYYYYFFFFFFFFFLLLLFQNPIIFKRGLSKLGPCLLCPSGHDLRSVDPS